MKQILSRILLLVVVIAAILGLSSCKIFVEQEPSTYDIVVNRFERNVVYGSELDLSGIDIEVTTNGEVKYVEVTSDMVTGGTTTEVGAQELVIEYAGMTWTLYYEVFYKIDHIVDGFIYDSQLVTEREEYMPVKKPEKEGSIFLGWSEQIPETLTGNLRIEAIFADGLTLPEFSATYGDTLGDLTLPETKDGYWSWKLGPETSVGNAGTNKFAVVFTPNNPAASSFEVLVDVTVAKKKLTFTIINDVYDWDGSLHRVEYQLSDGVNPNDIKIICFGTEYATEPGEYSYDIQIRDANYEGQIKGIFKINKVKLTVDVLLQDGDTYKDNATITYGDSFPSHKVVIKDKNGNDYVLDRALEVSINKPSMLIAGYYDIVATIKDITDDGNDDLRYYDITYNIAKLVVKGVDFDPGPPLLKENYDIYYGDLLSSIEFADHPNGVWVWDYTYNEFAAQDFVGNAGKNTFRAEFIPKDSSYNKSEAYIVLDVNKRVLRIDVDPASTSVVYDGQEHGLSYVIVDPTTGRTFDNLIVNGDVKYVAAYGNGYNITLSIDDANYTGSVSTALKINKADPVTDFSNVITLTWRTNLKLSDIALDAGYEWKYKNTTIDVAGEYIFDVIFTPEDTDNYNTVNGQITVIVEKAQSSITGVAEKYDSWTYNGSDFELNREAFGYEYVGGAVVYLYNGEPVTAFNNAGEYLIKLVIEENDTHLGCEVSTIVIIKKANPQISMLNINGWTYGDEANAPSAKTTFGDIVYRYYTKESDQYVLYGTDGLVAPAEAGTYYVHANVEATDNWNGAESIYKEFKIEKQTVALPSVDNIVYQGKLVQPTVAESELYNVAENGNEGGEDVGEYTVTLVLVDPNNYKWEGLSSATATVKYKITKFTGNVIEDFDGGEWTYEDTVAHSTESIFGEVRYTYYLKKANGDYEKVTEAKNAGEYKVEARVAETDNYNGCSMEKTFVIEKKSVDVPSLAQDQTSFVYTSGVITSGLTAPAGAYYKVSDVGGRDVGDYYVTLTLNAPSNYKWADGEDGSERKLQYSIVKDEVSITALSIDGWKYKGTINAPTVEDDADYTSATIKYQYKTPAGDWVDTTITADSVAGTYRVVATIADTTNYDGDVETFEFEIEKADNATINGIITGKKYTTVYNKAASYEISGLSGSHTESNLTYTITKNGESVDEMKSAGTYTVVITLPESDNYMSVSETVTVEITKKEISKPGLSSVSSYYNGGVFAPAPRTSDDYEHEFENASSIAAGTYKVTFTLTDENYVWDPDIVWESGIPGVLTYTIQKGTIGIEGNTSNRNNVPYTTAGYTLTDIVANGVDVDSTLTPKITLNGEEVEKITGVGTYTVTYNYVDATGNYNDREVKFTVTITKANNRFTTNPAGGKSWTYGNVVDTTVFGAKASFGEVKYRFFTDAEGNNPLNVTSETRLAYGTYYVQAYVADDSDNYDDCESTIVAFNITKATATITGAISSANSVYGQYAEVTKDELVANSDVTLAYGSAEKPSVTIMYTPVNGNEATSVDTIYNAGTYVVTYYYVDGNHDLVTETATVYIAPKTFSETIEVSATYDDKLSDVELPEVEGGHLEWHNGENKVGNVGNNVWLARFVADDSGNYADVANVSVTVVVSTKFITKPEWVADQTFEYDGTTSHSAVITKLDDAAYYDIAGNGNVAANEDGYTVTITLKSAHGDNIKWIGGTDEVLSFTYYVTKAPTSITITGFEQNSSNEYSIDLGKYDSEREYTIPAGTVALKDGTTATAGYVVKYIPNVGATVEDFKGAICDAGTYIITYTYAGNSNHSASNNATLTVTIGKADSSVVITPVTGDSIDANNKISVGYDGRKHLPTVTINGNVTAYSSASYAKPEGFIGSVTEIVGETAGTHTLVYSLTNDNNYADIAVTVTLDIDQVENSDAITVNSDARFDDKVLSKIILPDNENGKWSLVIVGVTTNTSVDVDTVFGEVTTYTYKATFVSTNVNYADDYEEGTITVDRKLVPEPTVNDMEYTGELITPVPEIRGPYTVTVNDGGKDHNIDPKAYYVEFTLDNPETHEWSKASDSINDIDGAKIKVYYDITNIVNKWQDGHDLAIEGDKWTYNFGEIIPVPTAMANEGTTYIQFRVKGTDAWIDWAHYDLAEEKWIPTGNAPIDNGTYEIRAIVYADNDKEVDEDNNGKGNNYDRLVSATKNLVINKAAVSIEGITVVGGTGFEYLTYESWNTSTLLNGISLKSDVTGKAVEGAVSVNVKYVPVIGETDNNYSGIVKNAGTYTIVYTFDGTGTNYVTETETIVITIGQSAASINGANADKLYTPEYDSDVYVVPGITASHSEATLVPTVTKDGKPAEMRNVGTYKVTYTLAETNNYSAATPVEVTVTIIPASATITADGKEFEYNGTAYDTNEKLHALIVASISGIFEGDPTSLTYTVSEGKTIKDQGTYEVIVSYDNGNYSVTSVPVTVTVLKKTVSIVGINDGDTVTKVYRGTEGYALSEIIGAYFVDVNGDEIKTGILYNENANLTLVNANESGYNVTITLNNANYEADSITVKVVIEKAEATIGFGAGVVNNTVTKTYAFDTSYNLAALIGASASHGGQPVSGIKYYVNGVETESLANVNESGYTVTVVVENDNYKAAKTVTFVIERISLEVPAVTGTYSYTGNTHNLTYTPAYDVFKDLKLADGVTSLVSISGDNKTQAGENYNVAFTLNDTAHYKWAGVDGATATASYSIGKATPTITVGGVTVSSDNKITLVSRAYGSENYDVLPEVLVNGESVGKLSGEITDAKIYTFTYEATETGNYLSREVTVTIEITKADNYFTKNPAVNQSWSYGNVVVTTAFGATASFGEVKYRFFTDAEGKNSITVTSTTILPYGDYYVQAYVEDNSGNYDDCESSIVEFNITKGTATISGTISSATSVYGEYAKTTKADLEANSSVTLAYGSAVKPVVTIMFTPIGGTTATPVETIYGAGTYVVTYSYEDGNHNKVTVEGITIVIDKAAPVITIGGVTVGDDNKHDLGSRYYGAAGYADLPEVFVNGESVGTLTGEITDATTYSFTYKATETDNYNERTVTVIVTVTPATATITAADKTFVYNGTAYDTNDKLHDLIGASISGIFEGDSEGLTYTVSEGKTIKDQGTYTVIVSYDNGNYSVESVPVTVTVNKKSVSIAGISNGAEIITDKSGNTLVYRGETGYKLSEIIGAYFVGVNGNETAGILYNGEADLALADANEDGYTVTITLVHDNYKSDDSITVNVVIEKAETTISLGGGVVNNTVTKTYVSGTSYNLADYIDASASVNGTIKYYINGVETESLSATNETGYTVTVKLISDNYKAEETVTFKIMKADSSVVITPATGDSIGDGSDGSKTITVDYDGKNHLPTVTINGVTTAYSIEKYVYDKPEGFNGDVTEIIGETSGKYTLVYSFEGNVNYNPVEVEVTLTITRLENNDVEIQTEKNDHKWTYGETPDYYVSGATIKYYPGTYDEESKKVVYSDDEYEMPEDGFMVPGYYKAVAAISATVNYPAGDAEQEFTVDKKEAALVNNTLASVTTTYGEYAEVPYSTVMGVKLQLIGTQIAPDITFTYNGKAHDGSIYNAGTYVITYSLPEVYSDNYAMSTVTVTIIIKQATPDVTAPVYKTDDLYQNIYFNGTSGNLTTDNVYAENGRPTASVQGSWKYQDLAPKDGSGVEYTYTLIFTPEDSNYAEVIMTGCSVIFKTVATLGTTPYGTIENAIKAAGNDGTVWVVPNTTGNVIIKDSITINSGVTLVLPYGEFKGTDNNTVRNKPKSNSDLTTEGENTEFQLAISNPTSYLKTLVIVNPGVVISLNGTIELSGKLSGGGAGSDYVGHTSKDYGELRMDSNSKIIVNSGGVIKAYGFITEAPNSTGSQINVKGGGSVYQPMVVRDFNGGSYMYTIYGEGNSKSVSPFHEFGFLNIHPEIIFEYGSFMYAWANIYAGDQQNATLTKVIGSSNNEFLVSMTNAEYSRIKIKFDYTTEICNIDVFGGARLNSLTLKINYLYKDYNISTSSVFFPINWAFNITLNRAEGQTNIAEYSFGGQKVQLLWGSRLVVGQGTKLVAPEIYVMDEYYMFNGVTESYGCTGSGNENNAPDYKKKPAQFIVNGELEVGALGGKIYSDTEGAKVTVTSSTTSTMYGIDFTYNSLSSSVSFTAKPKNPQFYNGLSDSNPSITLNKTNLAVSYNGERWIYKVKVEYDPMGGTISGDTYFDVNENNQYTVNTQELIIPERQGYDFVDWYVDSDCTQRFEGVYTATSNYSIVVYAKWSEKPSTHTIVFDYGDKVDDKYNVTQGYIVDGDYNELVGAPVVAPNADVINLFNNNIKQSLYFAGWEYDGKVITTLDSLKDLPASENEYVVKAVWKTKHKVVVNVSGRADNGMVSMSYEGVKVTINGDAVNACINDNGTLERWYVPGEEITIEIFVQSKKGWLSEYKASVSVSSTNAKLTGTTSFESSASGRTETVYVNTTNIEGGTTTVTIKKK